MKQNLDSFSLFFLNTYNFPIFKNCRRKTVWVVLIFDRFSIFRFLSLFFTVECLPGAGWSQRSGSNAGFIQTKILLQISLTRDGLFRAKSLWTNHPTFPLSPPCRVTPFNDLDFFRSPDQRAQSAESLRFLSPTILPVCLNACWFK